MEGATMIPHIFKVEGRTLTEADMDALIRENIETPCKSTIWMIPVAKKVSLDMIAEAIDEGIPVTLDGKPVTRENA
jgi:hypothetical protein